MTDNEAKGIDGYLFRLIATFEAAAMQQMGKVANPLTGDVEMSLDGAREAIEMLDMLKRKTSGNLNGDEERLLEHVLYQLRMNYVDVASGSSSSDGADGTGGSGTEGAGEAAEGDAEARPEQEPSRSSDEGEYAGGEGGVTGDDGGGDGDGDARKED